MHLMPTNYTCGKHEKTKQRYLYFSRSSGLFSIKLSGSIFTAFITKNRRNEILKCTLQAEYIELGIRWFWHDNVNYENLQKMFQ